MTLVRQLVLGLLGALFAVTGFVRAHSNSEPMTASNQFFMDGPQAMLEGAIRANDTPALARALASGASVNATGKFEATPLMIAVDVQNLAAVQSLLKAGASPNARAADRNSAVTLAVKSYQAKPYGRDILVAIIQGGGDPDTCLLYTSPSPRD